MAINRAINTTIDFCRKELIPNPETVIDTTLYAVGGFLSGRVFGFVSPMHGAIYLVASRTTYLAINHISYHIYRAACETVSAFRKKIEPAFEAYHYSEQRSSFSRCVKNGRYLVSSWMDSLEENLGFMRRMSLNYTNIYLSHHMANAAALSLLKMQPIAYRAAIKVVCSSTILTIFSSSVINFCCKEAKRLID